ncbi:hypothetical protein [Maribacter polysaccharolyticus]|uniref:hypothetical protein n=1 Tax=Maribacter polysaccharolyticus TaxID=3020831 RepID=UPI00237FC983|nr:hypothetical protein [Maribacter polysaccharolyticus]MDE3744013.1 hypothetical protein [Maribacter polysaccharolyticus]
MNIQLPEKADVGSLPVRSIRDSYKCHERYAYLLGIIYYKNKISGHSQNTGVELSSAVLRNLFGGVYSFYINNLIAAEYIIPVSAPYDFTLIQPNGKRQILHCKGTFKITTTIESKDGTRRMFKGHSKRYKLNTNLFGIKPKLTPFPISNPILKSKLDKVQATYSEKVLSSFGPARKQYQCIKKLSINPEVWEYMDMKYPTTDLLSISRYIRSQVGSKERMIAFLRTLKNNRLTKKNITGIMRSFGMDPYHMDYGYTRIEGALRLYFKRKYRSLIISKYEAIARGEHDFLRFAYDSKTNRLFTLVTETPKDIMPFVKMDGENLVEIDGNNTQWNTTIDYLEKVFRIGGYYKKAYQHLSNEIKIAKKQKKYYKVRTITLEDMHSYVFKHHRINFKKEIHDLHLLPEINYNGETYLNRHLRELFMSSKKWYDRLFNELQHLRFSMGTTEFRKEMLVLIKRISPDYPDERIKKDLLAWVLFGPTPRLFYKDNTVVKAFSDRYRNTIFALTHLKNRGFDHQQFGYSSYDRWKLLSVINQRKEASMFVVDSTLNIQEPFLTKHDALYVRRGDAETVHNKLKTILSKHGSRMDLSFREIYSEDWRDHVVREPIEQTGNDPDKVIEISARINKYSRLLKITA